ncbi:alkaline phosphatase family protein [Pedobacter sp. HMF7647]|uniref:Alkaline phosphatase family protein n=1 Tax=Hufsiella arboris TaxID=2695275 RepID=A0A7K1Y737_9SPHI|nr:alkaline phosphatase PafA [Hufsiella arboris]MXV49929.1 alkaline phosphatase family protein [Hufsiella arboris]
MKLRNKILLAFTLFSASALAQKTNTANIQSLPRPKLVVGIVVDQMRWDYLYRYYDRYSAGGFKRLLNDGFSCENTFIDYVPTVTAIGHSCIYTGSVPAIHGIAGNDWTIQATGKMMYCTEDTTVQTVGSTSKAGEMSPKNLLASTITDELKLATNFRSKVIGIALKDRGGILPAGHTPNAAYWYDDQTGNWISSTYYMKNLPAWVDAFNGQAIGKKYMSQPWTTLYPVASYQQSTADNSPYEGPFRGEKTTAFPHDISSLKTMDSGILRSTPFGNTFTLDFAKAAVQSENMGGSGFTDFLAVSLSSTDYVGHQFGPNSIEAEDTYLRLDKDLASFFSYLDSKVGKGNYTVFLSADHGAAHNPQFLIDHGIPAGLWPIGQVSAGLNAFLKEKYGQDKIVLNLGNYQVNLNNQLIASKKLNEDAIRKDCVDYLKNQDGVQYVVDMKDAASATVPAGLSNQIVNGYNKDRSGVVQIILKPGWYSGSSKTGTTHGTWNPYDAHIPLVFMGWGIKHGKTNEITHMTDISATLAGLLRIQAPSGCIGKPITEVLK